MFSLNISPYCFARRAKLRIGTSESIWVMFPMKGRAGGWGIRCVIVTGYFGKHPLGFYTWATLNGTAGCRSAVICQWIQTGSQYPTEPESLWSSHRTQMNLKIDAEKIRLITTERNSYCRRNPKASSFPQTAGTSYLSPVRGNFVAHVRITW